MKFNGETLNAEYNFAAGTIRVANRATVPSPGTYLVRLGPRATLELSDRTD